MVGTTFALAKVSVLCFSILSCLVFNTITMNAKTKGSVGSMPLQLLEIGFHVEIHAIEWHDFQRETQFHGVVVA
jgi:hypothetical protein